MTRQIHDMKRHPDRSPRVAVLLIERHWAGSDAERVRSSHGNARIGLTAGADPKDPS